VRPVRIGIQLPQFGPYATAEGLGAFAELSEELGFDSVWLSDHVVLPREPSSDYPYSSKGLPMESWRPFYEPVATMGFIAARTSRVRIGTSVLVPALRHPVLLAKMFATADALAGGRLVLGLGAGWLEDEFSILGAPPYAERGPVLEEIVALMTALWSGEGEFHGAHWDVPAVYFEPATEQQPRPPIWIGGNTDAAIHRAARVGDGWHPARLSPEEFGAARERLTVAVREAGRRPADVEPSLTALLRFTDDSIDASRLRDVVGTTAAVTDLLARYAEAGVGTFVAALDPHEPLEGRRETIRRLAEEVVPALESEIA
jgi:probable F420-dependent oxidoreductase